MSQKSKVVAVSVRTGKPIKSPRRGQKVTYSVIGPRGGVKTLSTTPQAFYKTDLKKLNQIVQNSNTGNYQIYEQTTRKILRDKKGRPILGKSGETLKQVKITGANPKRKQRPVLYKKGKKVRELSFAFQKGNYQTVKAIRDMQLVKLRTPKRQNIMQFRLKGNTIKQALSGLEVDVNFKQLAQAKRGLYYNILIQVVHPDKTVTWIPSNASWIPIDEPIDGFADDRFANFKIDGKNYHAMTKEVGKIADLKTDMSRSIRLALKDKGIRYTSPAVLNQIAQREEVRIAHMENAVDADKNAVVIEGAKKSLAGLFDLNGTNPRDLNTQITGKYRVYLYVQFEVI